MSSLELSDLESLWDNFKINEPVSNNEVSNNNNTKCNHCNSINSFITDFKVGDVICTNCGLVTQSRIILDEAEWNNYSEDGVSGKSMARCGPALDYTNPYETSGIFIPKNLWSIYYDSEGIKRHSNLSRLAMRIGYTSKQRAFNEGKYDFEHIQNILGLTDTIFNTAKLYWGIILKTDILKRGANRTGMKACCVFYACLSEKQQRTREEISKAFDFSGSNDFTKGEKIFREIFEKNNEYSWILYKNSENEVMYARYVKDLKLPYQVNNLMSLIKDHCKDHFLGIAAKSEIAGLLCYSCKELLHYKHPNKTEIANSIGICNPTLNKVVEIIKYYYTQNPEKKKSLNTIINKINN
jgi:transcription initiation factor TFIIIB Brf1 subunit/transcription initiation factor TFIIB